MSLQEAHRDRTLIVREIRQVLTDAVRDKHQKERQLVANLVRELPRAVNHKLAPIFQNHGVGLSAAGILARESVLVEVTDGSRAKARGTEIGDLLLVVSLCQNSGAVNRTALLLQARRSTGEYPPQPENSVRHQLYSCWPEFTYVKAGPDLNGCQRRVGPPHLYNGAKYLFLRSGDCPWPPFFCHDAGARARWNLACSNPFQLFSYTAFPTSPELTNFNCLVTELYDLLFGNGGRRFRFRPEGHTDWDQVITDLVEATAALAAAYPKLAHGGNGPGDALTGKSMGHQPGLLGRVLEEAGLSGWPWKDEGAVEVSAGAKRGDDIDHGGISIVEIVIEENLGQPGRRPLTEGITGG